MGLKVEAGKQRSPSVLKEVKATPPTLQRFPSPSPNRIKNVKAGMATAGSQLKKPLKMTSVCPLLFTQCLRFRDVPYLMLIKMWY
jgi:hypothetical protein